VQTINDREKEIKLLHLDQMQKDILASITAKFLKHKSGNAKEAVEAFVVYIHKLVELSAEGTKNLCDDDGNLSAESDGYLQKFTAAIRLCSGIDINYYKILSSSGVKHLLAKATTPRNRMTLQHIHELEYKIKILTYSLLDNAGTKAQKYLSDTEDIYMSGLASMNPIVMKHAFAEHIVDIISAKENHALSDIMELVQKYSKYLGNNIPSQDVMENLIKKYSDIEQFRDIGAVHAARVEIFKLFEDAQNEQ
jgi:hypothetical protein